MARASRDAKFVKGSTAADLSTMVENETVASSVARRASSGAVSSHDIFEMCIERARNLVKLHTAVHGKVGKPEKYISDAHRGAIVLAISALDAFVRDFVISRTRVLLADKSGSLPGTLSGEIRRFIKDEALLEAARKDDLLERVEKAFRTDFERRSFQGTRNIEEQLAIVGFTDVFHLIAVRAHINEDALRADLDRFTTRRHAIAHRGDYNLSENPPVEQTIKKKDAEECIKLVSLIAKSIHELGSDR